MCTLCSLQGTCLLSILAALAMAACWCAGLTPDSLYGKFTWKIENFDQVQKRELRSDVFVVGDYKWSVAFAWHCHMPQAEPVHLLRVAQAPAPLIPTPLCQQNM